jgi:nicotinate-nucleotide adenylyltransferase
MVTPAQEGRMKRCGILGGTFNPIHRGHLRIAEEARERLSLDQVIFVPAARPWMKAAGELAPIKDRLAMVRLAVKGRRRFTVSTVDVARPGPSYAVDSVRDIQKERGPDCELFFIMGMDSLASLPKWRNARGLLKACTLVVLARPGYPTEEAMGEIEKAFPGAHERIAPIETTHIDISATEIRERIAQGKPIGRLVPGAVAAYIARRKLYKKL